MPLVVGVSFKKAGKVYYFDPNSLELREGDRVIAETARGIEFGEVMVGTKEVPESEIVPPLKRVVRLATEADVAREGSNVHRGRQAAGICQQRIQAHGLPMKLIDAEYCFDGSQVTFYFSSESRVDFRELVKDLASTLKCKVQLHQVGVRDEARFFGGIGPCGRGLCCATFLNGFEPVSMKMAKEQCLFLNPLKFSGICGKLMCCLKFEYAVYRDAKARLPEMSSTIETPKGPGRVVELNMIREVIGVLHADGSVEHYSLRELRGDVGDEPQTCGCGECCAASERAPGDASVDDAAPVEGGTVSPAAADTSSEGQAPTGQGRRGQRGRRRPQTGETQPGVEGGDGQQPPQARPSADQPRKSAPPRSQRRSKRRNGRLPKTGGGGSGKE